MKKTIESSNKIKSYDQVAAGKRIRECRQRSGLSAAELASIVHCYPPHLRKIERGQEGASIQLMTAIAQALNTSTDYLMMGRIGNNNSQMQVRFKVIAEMLNAVIDSVANENTGGTA